MLQRVSSSYLRKIPWIFRRWGLRRSTICVFMHVFCPRLVHAFYVSELNASFFFLPGLVTNTCEKICFSRNWPGATARVLCAGLFPRPMLLWRMDGRADGVREEGRRRLYWKKTRIKRRFDAENIPRPTWETHMYWRHSLVGVSLRYRCGPLSFFEEGTREFGIVTIVVSMFHLVRPLNH